MDFTVGSEISCGCYKSMNEQLDAGGRARMSMTAQSIAACQRLVGAVLTMWNDLLVGSTWAPACRVCARV